ncbi:hypothetical protein ACMHYB_56780 [Sorangium sp. So ce1128]
MAPEQIGRGVEVLEREAPRCEGGRPRAQAVRLGGVVDERRSAPEQAARQRASRRTPAGSERPRRSRATSGAGDWTPVLSAGELGAVVERGPTPRPGRARRGPGVEVDADELGDVDALAGAERPAKAAEHVGRW